MTRSMRQAPLMAAATLLALCAVAPADAQISDDVVKIGVLNDQSGLYADLAGPGSVVAARMAVEDFGGTVLGKPIEVVVADHQNKADIGAAIARQWFDVDKVDMAIDFANSSVALAVEQLAKDRNRIAIATAVGSTDFTGKACTPNEASWLYDSYALTTSLAREVTRQGRDTWFFVTVDYAFGHSLEADTTKAVLAAGGKVLGGVRHPLNNSDFSSYLLQAKASGAKVVALADGGGDMINATKQAHEFGLVEGGQSLVSLLVFITDVHSLGLQAAQGLTFVTGFYWDRNDESRAFAKRFLARFKSMPTMVHASVYSAVHHYLRAIQAARTDEAKAVMAKMRALPVDDFYARGARLRLDGRLVHDMYLAQVKKPSESKGPWDYFKILGTIPGGQAFQSLEAGGCPLTQRH
ncbi:MAG TPA: ABC transporter substrate-binding protein [Stellaceae bacterium]|nr:ABC transporter substrate-binding protein [Stellaceae bacterium]